MSVTVDLQNASGLRTVPLRRDFKRWASAALAYIAPEARGRLSIRIVDEAESAELNTHYRHKQGATNILSFPVPPGLPDSLLGDLAICATVVEREATEQQKAADAHWAHLTVHGVLHLKGYDHEEPKAADEMEALEKHILQQLGYADPYQ
ncbi:MAG: Endoribonuclease YbeY [Pseudomonadota bacterium]|jgi:probable rRNA maturation factor